MSRTPAPSSPRRYNANGWSDIAASRGDGGAAGPRGRAEVETSPSCNRRRTRRSCGTAGASPGCRGAGSADEVGELTHQLGLGQGAHQGLDDLTLDVDVH